MFPTAEGSPQPLVATSLCSSTPRHLLTASLAFPQHLPASADVLWPLLRVGTGRVQGKEHQPCPHWVQRMCPRWGRAPARTASCAAGRGRGGVRGRPGEHLEGVDLTLLLRRALAPGQRSPVFSPVNTQSTQGVRGPREVPIGDLITSGSHAGWDKRAFPGRPGSHLGGMPRSHKKSSLELLVLGPKNLEFHQVDPPPSPPPSAPFHRPELVRNGGRVSAGNP